jgi:hypothetical protein
LHAGFQQQGFVAPGPPACADNACQHVQGGWPIGKRQTTAIGKAHIQWQALQYRFRLDADVSHQRQGVAVSANQDVLAVV